MSFAKELLVSGAKDELHSKNGIEFYFEAFKKLFKALKKIMRKHHIQKELIDYWAKKIKRGE